MCGIVGFVTSYENGFSDAEMQVFQTMLFVDTLRGWDSTGVFGVTRRGDVEIHKAAVHGADFICTDEFKGFYKSIVQNGVCTIGHNRAATKGSVSDENAHPFVVDDRIVLVQNGTLRMDHKKLAEVDVDSHALAHHLAKEADIAKALKEINGAYALVWYDVDNSKLHLIRNDERPLYLAELKQGGWVFASEQETIFYGLSKGSKYLTLTEAPKMLEEYMLYTFDLSSNTPTLSKEKLDCEYPVVYYSWYKGGNYYQHHLSVMQNAFLFEEDGYEYRGDSYNMDLKKRDVVYSIHKILQLAPDLEEFQCKTNAEAQEIYNYITNEYKEYKACVQVVNYYAANHTQGCTTYFILASIVDDKLTVPAPIVYWLEFETTEATVAAMKNKYYEVELASPDIMQYRDEASENVFICKVHASNITQVTPS